MTSRRQLRAGKKLVHINHLTGHRPSFITLFKQLFDMDPVVGPVGLGNFLRLVRADRLIFGTLDDDVRGFVLVSVARSLLRRPTAGIFMRPHACFFPGTRASVRRMLFVALRRVPLITTLSILPFEPSPNLRRVANRSVHDPQMWDLVGDDDVADPEMLAEVVSTAAGRPVISFLGTAFPAKGFGFLAAIISAKPEITQHLCIFVAGAVSEPCRADAAIMSAAGAMVVDRRVSDEELAALYQASDAIWACYHADYDQASGIFGRAVQYGRRAVIRHDAVVIGHYVDILGVKAICLPDDAELAADILLASFNDQRPDGPDLSETLRLWREAFVSEIDRGTGNLISDPKHAA